MAQPPKILLNNRPEVGSNAQYSLNVSNDLPAGILEGNVQDGGSELYTTITSTDTIVDGDTGLTNGRLWNWKDSKIQVTYAHSKDDNAETDGKRYIKVKFAIYVYDGLHPSGSALYTVLNDEDIGGNDIKAALGTGNSFDQTDAKARIGFWNKGNQKQDASTGDIVTEDKSHYNGTKGPNWVLGGGVDGESDLTVRNFPYDPSVSNLKMESFNTDLDTWTEACAGKYNNAAGDYIIFVFRQSGDERETIWPFGTKTDERNRSYKLVGIKKSGLYNKWKNSNGEIITIDTDTPNDTLYKVTSNIEDTYGHTAGHNQWANSSDPINFWGRIKLKITAPTWSKTLAEKDISDGGFNAKWVNYVNYPNYWFCLKGTNEIGLNPTYNSIDFYGFPSEYYSGTSGVYFNVRNNGELIYDPEVKSLFDWRPISYIETHYTSVPDKNQDLQTYHEIGSTENILASGPNTVKFGIKIAKEEKRELDATENIINLTTGTANDFGWYFFVVNWDWRDSDPGGGECEEFPSSNIGNCLRELGDVFPQNEEDFMNQKKYDRYILNNIKNGEEATHFYNEDGTKVIKAIAFQTINCAKAGSGTLIQAIRWKLLTAVVYLSSERAILQDFTEVGGSEFTYLPYPDRLNTNVQTLNSTTDNPEYYKISYPVIGGLSPDSTYIKSLKSIENTSTVIFDKREGVEKALALRSYENSPGRSIDEYGKFFGKSDLEQVRYFNSGYKNITTYTIGETTYTVNETLDMRKMLDITTVYDDGDTIEPGSNVGSTHINTAFWDGINNSFPKESIVGSIFINEDIRGHRELCLFEFNCGIRDGNTILDSSGHGCKGILFGDYSIKKLDKNKKTIRDSYIIRPQVGSKDKAI